MSERARWKNGFAWELLRDLRPGGWCMGSSPRFDRLLTLHKTDLIRDIKKLPQDKVLLWRLDNPENQGRYETHRRRVVIYLGS